MATFNVANQDVLRVTLIGYNPANNAMYNVFHFRVNHVNSSPSGLENDATSLIAGFWNNARSEWAAITGPQAGVVSFKIEGLNQNWQIFNTADWVVPSGPTVGTVTGDASPPWINWTYRYDRPNADFRIGFKRFGGCTEGLVSPSGIINVGSTLTLLAALATKLNADQTAVDPTTYAAFGDGATMEPVLYRRVVNGDVLEVPLVGRVANVRFVHLGSQNSRKYGIGI